MSKKLEKIQKGVYSVLILHDIRSVYNTGAIFRTADAIGINKVYLTGYTPRPIDRFGRKRKDFAKCALGAEESVTWESYEDINVLLEQLKNEGCEILALEQDERSVDYKEYEPTKKIGIILGNEPNGISADILNQSDVIVELPMKGEKESLNVSVATGIVLYRILDR